VSPENSPKLLKGVPMPKAEKAKGGNTRFLAEHASTYGLKVMERSNSGEVVSVRCQFCIYFGSETNPETPRQRATKTTKMAWTNSFRVDMYQKHHTRQHPSQWKRYQACCYDDKAKFFDSKVPFQNTMLAHVDSNATPLQINIDAPIVDILISDMFFHPDDQGGVTQKTALKLFIRKSENYQVSISNPLKFQLVVAYIARGMSFRQCEGILADTRKITGTSLSFLK